MLPSQLEEAEAMLNQIASLHDRANTAARILQGIVLGELKHQLGHGKWTPWLRQRYPKSQDTAGRCIRAGEDFLKRLQDPKFRTSAEFHLEAGVDVLRQDLAATLKQLESSKLDLSHPLVRAASIYANGRSFYQLCLDLGPGLRGGDTSGSRKKLSPEEEHEKILENAKNDFISAVTALDDLHEKELWKLPSISDSMLTDSAELLAEMAKQVRAWLKVPRRDRVRPDLAEAT
jgi:hypothetical protein